MSPSFRLPACRIVLAALVLSPASRASAAEDTSPAGRWEAIDERTHQARGVISLFEKDGRWFGRIERSGRNDGARCTVCTDDRKDQPLDGLVIIRDMRRTSGDALAWEGGDVLDPESGRIYRLKMRLEDHGAKLVLRGFFGVSLLGRSQTWVRMP